MVDGGGSGSGLEGADSAGFAAPSSETTKSAEAGDIAHSLEREKQKGGWDERRCEAAGRATGMHGDSIQNGERTAPRYPHPAPIYAGMTANVA